MIIAAVSARTPIGLTAVQTGFSARTGAIGLGESPLPDSSGETFTMGIVPVVSPNLQGTPRREARAAPALTDLFTEVQPHLAGSRLRLHLLLGEAAPPVSMDEPSLDRFLRDQASTLHGADVPVEVHPVGTGGGAPVLHTIAQQLDQSLCDAVLLGGVHTDCDLTRIASLSSEGRIYSADNRDGIVPGEGSAFVLLTRPDTARALGLMAHATVTAFAAGFESARPDNDDSAFDAKGLSLAVQQAISIAGGLKIGWLMNDLSCELYRLYEYQAMLARSQSSFCAPQVMDAPAQRLGHQGAATLPLHFALAAEAWRRGYAPFSRLLSTTGSDSGARTAVVLTGSPHRSS